MESWNHLFYNLGYIPILHYFLLLKSLQLCPLANFSGGLLCPFDKNPNPFELLSFSFWHYHLFQAHFMYFLPQP